MLNVIIQTLNCPHVHRLIKTIVSKSTIIVGCQNVSSDAACRLHEISVQTELKWWADLLQTLSSTMTSTTATTDCTLETYCVGKRSILANRQCVSPLITLRFHNYLVGGTACSSLLISNSLIQCAFFLLFPLPFIPLWVPTWTNPKFSVSCFSR